VEESKGGSGLAQMSTRVGAYCPAAAWEQRVQAGVVGVVREQGGGGVWSGGTAWKRERACGPVHRKEGRGGPEEEEKEWAQPKMNSIVYLFIIFSKLI
jgi:hypothetical protein